MKTILVLIALIGLVVFGGITYFESLNEPTLVENTISEEVVEEVVEETDVLIVAQEALDKANLLLDEEEAKLLEERAIIDSRLELIVEKRTSF